MNSITRNTWRQLIEIELKQQKEKWEDVVSCTLLERELDEVFYGGYGKPEGKPFTLWTHDRVYFPVTYKGAEWVSSVSRLPNAVATNHIGLY